jgi:hypothetical protein
MWKLLLMVAAQAQAPQLPTWMAGCWEQVAQKRSTVECWSVRDGSTIVGESISKRGGEVIEREAMQIIHSETDDPAIPWMIFRPMPAGQKATEFHWVPSAEEGLTFLNAEHDYPQRIRYWREGQILVAEIAAADGSKTRRWRYSRRSR